MHSTNASAARVVPRQLAAQTLSGTGLPARLDPLETRIENNLHASDPRVPDYWFCSSLTRHAATRQPGPEPGVDKPASASENPQNLSQLRGLRDFHHQTCSSCRTALRFANAAQLNSLEPACASVRIAR
jgi:hypothetical protein